MAAAVEVDRQRGQRREGEPVDRFEVLGDEVHLRQQQFVVLKADPAQPGDPHDEPSARGHVALEDAHTQPLVQPLGLELLGCEQQLRKPPHDLGYGSLRWAGKCARRKVELAGFARPDLHARAGSEPAALL